MTSNDSPQLHLLCQLLASQKSPHDIDPQLWDYLVQLAKEHEMRPLLAWQLAQNNFVVEHALQSKLTKATAKAAAHYALIFHAQKEITAILKNAEISHIWLKGTTLAHTVYPQPFHRPMLDIDILVRYEQRLDALSILESIGYQQTDHEDSLFSPNEMAHNNQLHHFFLQGGAGNTIVLELHFHLLGGDSLRLSEQHLAWFWEQTTTFQSEDFSFIGFSPEAHLLYLCAHATLHHGLNDFVLKRYLDVHCLVQKSAVNWDTIIQQAIDLRWSYAVETCLLQTQALFDTPIPSEIIPALRDNRHSDENIQSVNAISGDVANAEIAWMKFVELSWRERIHYMHKILLPPQAYMRQHYHIEQHEHVWKYYLRRWLNQSRQIGKALKQRVSHKRPSNSPD